MCLLVFAWNAHPDYRLIFAGNRDEFHERPTRAARWWPDRPHMLGGRDERAGGTWLCLSDRGRFAVVTNFREPDTPPPEAASRGGLPLRFVDSNLDAGPFVESLEHDDVEYGGYNLLACDFRTLAYATNRGGNRARVDAGIHGLSNHLLDTPWPKVRRSRERLSRMVDDNEVTEEALFELLGDTRRAPAEQLPDTGIGAEREALLSPPFIVNERYGTRASTVLLVGRHGDTMFRERRFDPEGNPTGESAFELQLPVDWT